MTTSKEWVWGLLFGAGLALLVLLVGTARADKIVNITDCPGYVSCPPAECACDCNAGEAACPAVTVSCPACPSVTCPVCEPKGGTCTQATPDNPSGCNEARVVRRTCRADRKWRKMHMLKCITVTAEPAP